MFIIRLILIFLFIFSVQSCLKNSSSDTKAYSETTSFLYGYMSHDGKEYICKYEYFSQGTYGNNILSDIVSIHYEKITSSNKEKLNNIINILKNTENDNISISIEDLYIFFIKSSFNLDRSNLCNSEINKDSKKKLLEINNEVQTKIRNISEKEMNITSWKRYWNKSDYKYILYNTEEDLYLYKTKVKSNDIYPGNSGDYVLDQKLLDLIKKYKENFKQIFELTDDEKCILLNRNQCYFLNLGLVKPIDTATPYPALRYYFTPPLAKYITPWWSKQ